MSQRAASLSIRLWVGLALGVIIAVPALTTVGLYTAGTWWQQQAEQSARSAARQFVGADVARWSDLRWQTRARARLAALGVDALLFSADGRQLFATASTALPRQSAGWRVWVGEKDPISTDSPAGGVRGMAVLFVSVFPSSAILTGALAAGLLALLPTLAAVGWFLGRTVVRPLRAMSGAARGIREGDLTVRLPGSRVREVADVAAALEVMSGGLREAVRRQADLEQERRLFVGAIAHDLRTPVFTLRAYLGGLRDGLATTPEKAARYVEVCQDKAEALERLIADLFAYTRLEYLE